MGSFSDVDWVVSSVPGAIRGVSYPLTLREKAANKWPLLGNSEPASKRARKTSARLIPLNYHGISRVIVSLLVESV